MSRTRINHLYYFRTEFIFVIHFYLKQGQYQNDLRGLVFDNQSPFLPKIPGEYILENVFQIDLKRSKWLDLSVLFGMIFVYRLLFFVMIKISEDVTPWIRGYIARRRLQKKGALVSRVPSLRGYVVEVGSSTSSSSA